MTILGAGNTAPFFGVYHMQIPDEYITLPIAKALAEEAARHLQYAATELKTAETAIQEKRAVADGQKAARLIERLCESVGKTFTTWATKLDKG